MLKQKPVHLDQDQKQPELTGYFPDKEIGTH